MEALYKAGDKYNYVTLTGKCYMKGYFRYVECLCDCGKIWFTILTQLKTGHTKSCGCKKMSFIIKGNTKHGMTLGGKPHPIYRAWHQIQERCKGNTTDNLKNYKNRGIRVCEEWINSFDIFYKWALENEWRKGLTLERKNNDKGYSPDNCEWATHKVQSRNKTTNFYITAFGETKCLTDWANDIRCVPTIHGLRDRIVRMGYKPEDAILFPKQNNGGGKKKIA